MHHSKAARGEISPRASTQLLRAFLPLLLTGCVDLTPPWGHLHNRGSGDGGSAVDVQAADDRTPPRDRSSSDTAARADVALSRDGPEPFRPDTAESGTDESPNVTADDGSVVDLPGDDAASPSVDAGGLCQDADEPGPDLHVAPADDANADTADVEEPAYDTRPPAPDLPPNWFEEPLPEATVVSRDGLKIWLRADHDFVPADGTAALWKSITEPPAKAVAESPGTSPTHVAASPALGGKPALLFDGKDDALRISPRPVQDDFTMIVVLWTISTAGTTDSCWYKGSGLIDGDVPGSGYDFGLGIGSDGRIRAGVGNGGLFLPDTCLVSAGPAVNNGAAHVAVFARTRTTGVFTIYVDGLQAGSTTGSTLALSDPSRITIAALQSGMPNNPFAGLIAEVLVYARALPTAARKAVEGYLGSRYDFPVAQ